MQRLPVVIPAVQPGVTAAAVYTVGAGITSTINNLSLTNTSAAPVSVTLYRVPSGGTAAAGNCILSAFALAAGQSYVPQQAIGLQMSPGMTLQALATTAAVVTLAGGAYETSGS